MSWRAILDGGAALPAPAPQYSQNPQNPPPGGSFEDIGDSGERDSQLREALASACVGVAITPTEVRDSLAADDVADWAAGRLAGETLAAFARALVARREMDAGARPAAYQYPATCRQCGPIWLYAPGKVHGCTWCWNRLAGRPIPRPVLVRCGECRHFARTPYHPRLGRCQAGEPMAAAGNWDSDQRPCPHWLPKEVTP